VGFLPDLLNPVADRTEGKGQQIHHHKELGHLLLAVPEVMFHVIAMVFQHVESRVFSLPAGACASGDLGTWSLQMAKLVTKPPCQVALPAGSGTDAQPMNVEVWLVACLVPEARGRALEEIAQWWAIEGER
jgi:hypothetical protein